MNLLDKCLDNSEEVIFKLKKKIWLIPAMLICCPGWILLTQIFIIPCYRSIFVNAISFEADTNYILTIISFLVLIPLSIILPVSYVLNDLIITNKKVYIKKGIYGQLSIVDINDLIAYQHIEHTSRGVISHFINFYLRNGKRIKTGNLYIKESTVNDLINILNKKIGKDVNTKSEIKEIREYYKDKCNVKVKRNFIFPIISFCPFLIAIIMTGLYLAGGNRIGFQREVSLFGIVEYKHIVYDKSNDISGYEFEVVDKNNEEKYTIPVTEEIYYMFNQNEKVHIEAKRGMLGILYDEWFYQE